MTTLGLMNSSRLLLGLEGELILGPDPLLHPSLLQLCSVWLLHPLYRMGKVSSLHPFAPACALPCPAGFPQVVLQFLWIF